MYNEFMKPKDILANLLWFSLFLGFFAFPAQAITEFTATNELTYEVNPRGNGSVNQEISLTNNFSNIFPKEYQLQVIGNKIENITAFDSKGSILKKVEEFDDKTVIKLSFNDSVVGKDKQTFFTINYELPNLATKRGQIWEIAIPELGSKDEFANLKTIIKVPQAFGSLAYSSISPQTEKIIDNQLVLTYNKNQLGNNPILLAFGEFQIFDFDLDFTLINQTNQVVTKTVPIPPETSYQSVFLTGITPKPTKIAYDEDYNWLAYYQLSPGQVIEINVQGQAKIYSRPENKNITELNRASSLTPYLKDDEYWQVNSPIIQNIADYFSNPKQIYNFVIDELEYDFENLTNTERLGAVETYEQKKGVCTEFSDLFITLARANQIPARELEGFAFTENKELFTLAAENDVLHSWVEYWDSNKNLWVPADPTWAKTTEGIDFIDDFDLGHFAFVIHGHSSTNPAPPGFYKTTNNQKKNVKVNFAEKLVPPPDPKLEPNISKNEIIIKNNSFSPIYQVKVILHGWNSKKTETKTVEGLPPLGEASFEIEEPGFWARLFQKSTYKIEINNKKFELNYPRKKLNFFDIFANLWPG